jgi:hypothetical protein
VVEHRDVLGHPDRVLRRQHDAELTDAQPLGLHADEEIQQDRVVGQLEALDVKVMLGEADRVVEQLVCESGLLAQLLEHAVVEITT